MEVTWNGEYQSETGALNKRTGLPMVYRVSLVSDGTAFCSCTDFIIRGANAQNLRYRCKHIKRAAADHPEWDGSAATPTKAKAPTKAPTPAPEQATAPTAGIVPLDEDDFEPIARRRS